MREKQLARRHSLSRVYLARLGDDALDRAMHDQLLSRLVLVATKLEQRLLHRPISEWQQARHKGNAHSEDIRLKA